MKKKKDFTKFTKRNTHKRRSKEAAKRELMKAVNECGVKADGVKIRDLHDSGRSGNITARGIYSGSKSSFGFVSLEGEKDDIFIPGGNSRGAIDGDFVEIVYHKFRNRDGDIKTEGRVTKIVEYGRRTVIGTLDEDYRRHGRRYFRVFYIQPDDPKIGLTPYVSDLGGARLGQKVEALILRDGSSDPLCDIIRVFGDAESREANYDAILSECDIITEFTPEELAYAESVASEW